MAKLFIIDSTTGDKMPFLRGVLVESLVRIGLGFQDAYLLAQSVRDGLADETKVTTQALKQRVLAELRRDFGASRARAYDLGATSGRQIMVRGPDDETPFSTGILSRSLQACAIERMDAVKTARHVHKALHKTEVTQIDIADLHEVIHQQLAARCSRSAAEGFLAWRRFRESGVPLIVLVGGITGTGKSTLTTELAYQLNIVRTQSTDMMREIVRCYLPVQTSPTLGYSSFEAWRGLPPDQGTNAGDEAQVIGGFLSQFNTVRPGLEATIGRAVKEAHDLIVDGVHVLPSRLELNAIHDVAVVVPVMLVVPTKKVLAKRLKRRAKEQPERTPSRYLKQIDNIWLLQSYLVREAEDNDIPLIVNQHIDETLQALLAQVRQVVSQRFAGTSGS